MMVKADSGEAGRRSERQGNKLPVGMGKIVFKGIFLKIWFIDLLIIASRVGAESP